MSALLDSRLDPERLAAVAEWDARQRAAAAHTRAGKWRVRGPFRGQDGQQAWQVVRQLGADGRLDIDRECINEATAQRVADELNAGGGAAR